MESFVSNDQAESNCGTSLVEPKRKRRRIESDVVVAVEENQNVACRTVKRWRTEREQQIYSSKLLQALRHVRGRSRSFGRGREVRETADRVLAVSAKGATRWSRAILASSLSLRLKRRHKKVKVAVTGCNRLKKKTELKTTEMMNKKKLPAVEKKLRVLGRLIPGCRKASCLNLLEEASDYIAALEMQVRTMAALAQMLAASPSADERLGANVAS